jgi:hypothetical protein
LDRLVEAHGRVFLGCIEDLETVGRLIEEGVASLAADVETGEREDAAQFAVEYQASPQLKVIQSVVLLVRHRFHGIRAAAASNPANLGSPASFLGDLLPGVADW